ncbi:MAG: DUF433 domain-containing protein [Thermoguttaceae bacterium]|jgi:uncharacterized protein (DUF433 family)
MENIYVERHDGGYWVGGTRVSLDSVVLAFLQGLSPEAIASECFPALTLEQVYGAIAYYLAHRPEIDAYLKQADAEFDALREALRSDDPDFARKLAEARRQMQTPVS